MTTTCCRRCGAVTIPLALGGHACAGCLRDEERCNCTPIGTVEGCGCDACRSAVLPASLPPMPEEKP